jgi:6-phosphogluconolactonase/glucosamine-6-phosphate isomerase/deaminase
VQLFKDAIVVNKSEPKPEGERRSLTITVVVEIHAVVMVVEIAVVEKTVVVETEEDIIPFYILKKKVSIKLTPFFYLLCKKYLL